MLNADYWNELYLKGDTGWDKGQPSPPLVRMFSERIVPAGATLAVIGAGKGHDALEAARQGYRVTAVDFAPEAIQAISAAAKARGLAVEVAQADIFKFTGSFDAVVEHTCFCAIDVARRAEYVQAVIRMLKPKGTLLGLFFAHGREGGPPFDTSETEIRQLFSPHFTVERLVTAPDSLEVRAGKELEFVFRLK